MRQELALDKISCIHFGPVHSPLPKRLSLTCSVKWVVVKQPKTQWSLVNSYRLHASLVQCASRTLLACLLRITAFTWLRLRLNFYFMQGRAQILV